MKNEIKIIISGLDNAGKTSILTAFNKRYDFEKEVKELQPTRKIEYHQTEFLNNSIAFWDMGGQNTYRSTYLKNPDQYFSDTDLIIYIIDIQDKDKFDASLEYLNSILKYYKDKEIKVPLIVALHKFDPEIREKQEFIENAELLTSKLLLIEELEQLFIQTSIYDVLSIVELISTSISILDEQVSNIKQFLETSLVELNLLSLILFDAKGVIISENISDALDHDLYIELIGSIKDHIIQLGKTQEEDSEIESQYNQIGDDHLSYLHQLVFKNQTFYISALIKKQVKAQFSKSFPKVLKKLNKVLKPAISK